MSSSSLPPESLALAPGRVILGALTWRRVAVAALMALLLATLLKPIFVIPFGVLLGRMMFIAALLLIAFSVAGAWRPARLPPWLIQVLAIVVVAPFATLLAYLPSVDGRVTQLLAHPDRVMGIIYITATVLIIAPLLALAALYRERDAQARSALLAFALERSTLEKEALDARLKLLQAQIEPHFLFNTLANVQELVESGSAQAGPVLRSLIAYLRAAMPKLHAGASTLGNEIALVRAYLELMRMRMPDRLSFSIEVPDDVARDAVPADERADAGRERGAARHRPGREGWPHRRRRAPRTRRGDSRRRCRQRRRHERIGRAGHRPGQPGSAAQGLLRQRGAARAARGGAARPERRDRLPAGRAGRRMKDAALHGALIADDEPLLRERLRSHLARLWPELAIVAEARNGREAIELFETHRPQIAFLDVHMPGLNGIDAARSIARRAEIVFVTAHEHYAVQAFEQGAIDYVVKPFEESRLADSVARLRLRLAEPAAAGRRLRRGARSPGRRAEAARRRRRRRST